LSGHLPGMTYGQFSENMARARKRDSISRRALVKAKKNKAF